MNELLLYKAFVNGKEHVSYKGVRIWRKLGFLLLSLRRKYNPYKTTVTIKTYRLREIDSYEQEI